MGPAQPSSDTYGEDAERRQLDRDGETVRSFPSSRPRLAPTLRLELCGVRVDHLMHDELVHRVERQLLDRHLPPLAVGSVNLDHLHHFGQPGHPCTPGLGDDTRWLMLIDGAPVERRANRVTGLQWPRLTGADLLPDMLAVAARARARVGFLGGNEAVVETLRTTLTERWPDLVVAGHWTPSRGIVDSPAASHELAREIAANGVELLVVGLGKPRQECWISAHGETTGTRALLAFGAAADFLSGSARRAPVWMRRAGLEWLFRLALEPRRLARRYLIQGPPALWSLRHAHASVTYRETPMRSATSFTHRRPERRALAP